MHLFSVIGVGLLHALPATAVYTWPSQYDQMEEILYLQSGYIHQGFRDGVTPCSFSSAGAGRQTAAEWIRTAYHDFITHDASTGLGGLDASIALETDRAENVGAAINGTFGFTNNYYSVKASTADLIALSVVVASKACGGPDIPFRAGRVDATAPGIPGVPQPQEDLPTHTARFATAGFNTSDMITMVACGHVLGGVHGVDFPQVTGDDSATNFVHFDSTYDAFDNTVVTEYLGDNTTNLLVVGHNETTNSDKRVFGADGNKTMHALADPDSFQAQCADILARMIDTVPAAVQLSDVLEPVDVKPRDISLSLNADGTLSFSGRIRVRTTDRDADSTTVSLQLRDRNNNTAATISAMRPNFLSGQSQFFNEETFTWYEFDSSLNASSGISSFDVVLHTTGADDEINTNNGAGFPVTDVLLFQQDQSCEPQTAVNAAGQWNLTITAAVRADHASEPVAFDWVYSRARQGAAVAALEVQRTVMEKSGEESNGYYLFSATKSIDPVQWSTTFDLVLGEGDDVTKVEFLQTGALATSCAAFS